MGVRGTMLSLSEISVIEEADSLGVQGLGVALDKLLERWDHGLRDDETFIRIVFLKWYSITEPTWYNGLPNDSSAESLADFIEKRINSSYLTSEAKFIIGILSGNFPWAFGDEIKWKEQSNKFLLEVESQESLVFKNWKYLKGQSKEANDLKKDIYKELHARFKGRGAMGSYLLHILNRIK